MPPEGDKELRKIAEKDQQEATVNEFAVTIASFYKTLKHEGLPDASALQISLAWSPDTRSQIQPR